jgi:hypothetical protein
VRQGDPNGFSIDEKLDVNGIRVARGDGNDQRLVNAMNLFLSPAVGCDEVSKHS